MNADDIIKRNNVTVTGAGDTTVLLAHGFGCDQTMWRFLMPHLVGQYRVVAFDYVGSGRSDPRAFSASKYSSLHGYAQDILDVCEAIDGRDVVVIGHSVSAMTAMMAAGQASDRIARLVMVCPSPYFLNDPPHYHGGFAREDLEELIALMDQNYIGWAHRLAPLVIGDHDDALVRELSDSFCSTDPVFAKAFAKATFFSDCRDLLGQASQPALVLQSSGDALASVSVGRFIQSRMAHASLEIVEANGHCLHMTNPEDIAPSIRRFIGT